MILALTINLYLAAILFNHLFIYILTYYYSLLGKVSTFYIFHLRKVLSFYIFI